MRIYNFNGQGKTKQLSEKEIDEGFMDLAIDQAKVALSKGEVPIGAVVVSQGKVIGKGYNLTEQLNDVTAHAEMQAITAASQFLGGKYLKDCTLYVTVEPCVMCTGALYWSQISRVIYAAPDPKRGSSLHGGLYHPKTQILSGVRAEVCAELIQSFFRNKR